MTEPTEPLRPGGGPWWRERWWIWFAGLGVVAIVIVIVAIVVSDDGETQARARVAVPNVVGLQEAEAVELVEAAGLTPEVERGSGPDPAGTVVGQKPAADEQVAEGSTVLLTVSGGPQTDTMTVIETVEEDVLIEVPDVTGLQHVEAGETIDRTGLIADSAPVESDLERGMVVAQRPAPGTELEPRAHVDLEIALGPGDRPSEEIPDVTGPSAQTARAIARESGFTVRTIDRDAPTAEEVGEVILQKPAAGTMAPVLSQITLYVGR